MRPIVVTRFTLFLVPVAWLLAPGCSDTRPQADTQAPRKHSGGPEPRLTATCTVSPECPPEARAGEQAVIRSAHTWVVNNNGPDPVKFTVILEISDNLGHAKRKEVPGEVKARGRIEDSTSIALTTTYSEAATIDAQTRTTVQVDAETLTSKTATCTFAIR